MQNGGRLMSFLLFIKRLFKARRKFRLWLLNLVLVLWTQLMYLWTKRIYSKLSTYSLSLYKRICWSKNLGTFYLKGSKAMLYIFYFFIFFTFDVTIFVYLFVFCIFLCKLRYLVTLSKVNSQLAKTRFRIT